MVEPAVIVELPSVRSVCRHESFHTASLIADDQTPLSVTVDVWLGATDGVVWHVVPDWERHDFTPKTMTAQLVSVVLGPMSEGEPQVNIACWPITPDKWRTDGNQSDGKQAKFLAGWLKLDQVGWGRICYRAAERMRDPRFQRLAIEIMWRLEDAGELYQSDLTKIAERIGDEST